MARIRTIKPEFPQSESMGRVSRDARLLFLLLFTIVDDEGRARAAPRMLASLLYPYDDDAKTHIVEWLFELEREGSICLYSVDGNAYLQIEKWLSHQKIDKPSKSRLPPLPDRESREGAKPREASVTYLVPRIMEWTKELLPADAGPSKPKAYPEDFEKFWKAYPTDRNMPKKLAFKAWQKLPPEKRTAALAAIPGFKRYCEQNKSWYRVIYADRFLSQEKFEGYEAESEISPASIEAANAAWGGRAATLVAEIGAPVFQAWFGEAQFEPGPPVKISFSKPFHRQWVDGHFRAQLQRAFGEFDLEIAA